MAEDIDETALRAYLDARAAEGTTVTYAEAAHALRLRPPHTIHRLAEALERTMDTDAAAGRPFAAAVVVSRTGAGLPAPGFFVRARELGRYDGPDRGESAAAFHRAELARLYTDQ